MNLPGYRVVNDISSRASNRFQTLLCADKFGDKYVIKHPASVRSTSTKKALVNEYRVNKILFQYSTQNLHFPRVVDMISRGGRYHLVSEYISGKSLGEYGPKFQANTIAIIIHELAKISQKLTGSEKRIFPKRNFVTMLFLLPIHFLILLTVYPIHSRIIIKSFISCLGDLKSIFFHHPTLAHRDLKPENVIILKNKIYLLDCESLLLTHPSFDFHKAVLSEPNSYLAESLVGKRVCPLNKTLARYICLSYASSFGKKSQFAKHYLKKLLWIDQL